MKICKVVCVLFLCFMTFNCFAAELTLSVDKKVLTEADTLLLTIKYTGSGDNMPDLSPLNDDFAIISNSSAQQINFINGNLSQSKKWTLGLQPLKTGKIKIPPLRLGNTVSNSEEVEVKEVSDVAYVPGSRENSNSPYFKMDQTIDVSNPYIQQQATLLVNIYDSIGMQDGSFSIDEESKKDWTIIPLLDKPLIRQDVINNKKMNIETYAFAVFPLKSGKLTLPQISFDGYYVKDAGFNFPNFNDDLAMFGVNFHNVFGQRVPVRMKTKDKEITIKPIPTDFSGSQWLPLSDLKISSNWSAKKGFKVGEAVTRTIFLEAQGMTESMFPTISFANSDGLKQYPEKPEISERVEKGLIVTSARVNNVYIPTKSGELTIPEIKIKWFNVKTKTVETAVLEQETIFVLPNPDIDERKTVSNDRAVEEKQEKTKADEHNQIKEITPDEVKKSDFEEIIKKLSSLSVEIYAGLAAIFVLLILAFRICFSLRKKHSFRNAVIKALRRHDYKGAKDALLIWAKVKYFPLNINNFNDISLCAKDEKFSESLSALNKFLYSDSADFFDVANFIEIFKKVDKMKKNSINNAEALPNLYD